MEDVIAIADLVDAVRRGDAEARERLADAWLPVVLRWTTCLGGPLVDPEDAAHDVLLLALTRIDRLRDPACFAAWLFGMTRRTLSDHRRSRWLRRWLPDVLVEMVDGGESPVQRRERDEVSERVQRVLDRLTTDHREVLVLCDVEERTDEEAALLLDVPVGTVKSRLRRARARFAHLARLDGLAPDGGSRPDDEAAR